MENEENKISQIVSETLGNLKNMVDVNTVIGDIISMPDGTHVLPISKMSVGFLTGGGEYGETHRKATNFPFSGGSGAGFSVKPIGFFVCKGDTYKIITIDDEPTYKKLVEMATDLAKTYIKTQGEKSTMKEEK